MGGDLAIDRLSERLADRPRVNARTHADRFPSLQALAGLPVTPELRLLPDPVEPRPARSQTDDRAQPSWRRSYRRWLVSVDVVSAVLGAVAAMAFRFGAFRFGSDLAAPVGDLLVAVSLPLAWVLAIAVVRGYPLRQVGDGPGEFGRAVQASGLLTVGVAVGSYVAGADIARGFVVVAVPSVAVLALFGRGLLRLRLRRQRASGQSLITAVLVGDPAAVGTLSDSLARERHGVRVVGACLVGPLGSSERSILRQAGVGHIAELADLPRCVRTTGADLVAIASSPTLGPQQLRSIAWALEGSDVELIVDPGLVEVGGRRLRVRPLAGLTLLQVDQPSFDGVRRYAKAAFDRIIAGLALLLLAPLLVSLAVAVRITSSGPALYPQRRVGLAGRTFMMYKFRSMVVGADARLELLRQVNIQADGPLFKLRDDPRVTRLGRFMRRFSLDELPQLMNVLLGQMSLVGPRPPLPSEVRTYDARVSRRLLVKPGLTGLWQVSGRSDLSWEESIRLDLRYVEDWSLGLDLLLLWRTVRAVITARGAY